MEKNLEGRGFVVTTYKFLTVLFVLLLAACGTQDGSSTGSGAGTDSGAGTVTVASVTLSSSLATGTVLAQGGTTTVTAKVTGSDGNPIANGTEVTFTATAGTITGSVPTVSGQATATYSAGSTGGTVTITATASGVESNPFSLSVASGAASSVVVKSITPERLGLKGSGVDEVGTVVFSVTDAGGSPVSDGQVVNFTLDSTTGGGESLSVSSASTVGGEVSVALSSGVSPGVATITAMTSDNGITASTEARITMGYGKADQNHLGLAFEKLNVAGLVEFGIENRLSAYVADRYSNPVPAGAPVSFASECGIVSLTDDTGAATNFTNAFGKATAVAITAEPVVADGACTYIIWTEGEESFVDRNGNGFYDAGDTHTDIGEPYIDANSNNVYDFEETYFDLDGNGQYTYADGVWQSDTFIWISGEIIWSDNTDEIQISPSDGFFVPAGGSQDFDYIVQDINGNSLPSGTTIKVTSSAGTLTGDTEVTLQDTTDTGPGITDFRVTLSSDDDTVGDPAFATITIVVSATPNGEKTKNINGSVD